MVGFVGLNEDLGERGKNRIRFDGIRMPLLLVTLILDETICRNQGRTVHLDDSVELLLVIVP